MRKTQNGAKRPRDDSHNKPLKFIRGLTLSQHPPEQRKDLFLMKLQDVAKSQSLDTRDFEGYTIRERFAKVGWEQLLNLKCDKVYKRVVIQWTASLSRNGDTLTSIVDEKSYTITPAVIRDILKVDTRTDLPYACFNINDFQPTTENKIRWLEACKTVFGTVEDVKSYKGWYNSSRMTPLVKILSRIGTSTFLQGLTMMASVKAQGIWLLHSLFTGEDLYSFAHIMIDNIWDMYEKEHRKIIPYGNYISEILNRLGAVSKDEYVEVAPPGYRLISRVSFSGLSFSESPTEYIIDDYKQRIKFPKIVTEGEAPVDPPSTPQQPSNPLVNMTNCGKVYKDQKNTAVFIQPTSPYFIHNIRTLLQM
ncbi:hypothetical protein CTI12_AA531750 [Artemisia annua]|uniref:Uncharacterized protein n=1 Tax=Artemisia annua TaxID=35608 RepID=A0A2U1L4B9_ARTAN|nr:hypothetical protein CTI12_AA531750 [Artemisia annua]